MFERRGKQLVFLGIEIRFCSQHKCQLHNWEDTLGNCSLYKHLDSHVFETWTLPQGTQTSLETYHLIQTVRTKLKISY